MISEFAGITDNDVFFIFNFIALFTFLQKLLVSGLRPCKCDIRHTSPNFLAPVLERIRGVDGRIRLMWLPATVGTLSIGND